MTAALWKAMEEDCQHRLQPTDHLVSGGAAWADHLAVLAFLEGTVTGLTLYLPAPFLTEQGMFQDKGGRNAAAVSNYYHARFSQTLGLDAFATRRDIQEAIRRGANVITQPFRQGYAGLFLRNALVAKAATDLLAYTFGENDAPTPGGTRDTWDQAAHARRIHVSLADLLLESPAPRPSMTG